MSRVHVLLRMQLVQEIAAKVTGQDLPKEVVNAAKTQILGTSTFLTTDTAPAPPPLLGGIALKGNCKVPAEEAQVKLETGLKERCGFLLDRVSMPCACIALKGSCECPQKRRRQS